MMPNFARLIALASLVVACKAPETARATVTADSAAPLSADRNPANDPMVAHADSARIRGSSTAKVWLIVASDFQCPYCKMWHDSSDATIRRDYIDNGKVRLAYINYPIGSHQNAVPAAEYAMCAAAQDKFWPMHDALFASQEQWAPMPDPKAKLDEVAKSVGADMTALEACVSSHKMRPLIEADHARAVRTGVRATPSFVIGTQLLEGAVATPALAKALDAALAAAK